MCVRWTCVWFCSTFFVCFVSMSLSSMNTREKKKWFVFISSKHCFDSSQFSIGLRQKLSGSFTLFFALCVRLVYVTCWCIFPVIKLGFYMFVISVAIVGSFNVISFGTSPKTKKCIPWIKQNFNWPQWFVHSANDFIEIGANKCNIIWRCGTQVHWCRMCVYTCV